MINMMQCRRFAELLTKSQYLIKEYMLHSDYKSVKMETEHVSGTECMEHLVEMLDKFTHANLAVIEDHDRKVRNGRRTSRHRPD